MDTLHTTIVKSRANLAKLGKNNFSAFPTELGKKPWGVFPSTAGKARKLRLFPLRFGSDIEFWQKDKKNNRYIRQYKLLCSSHFGEDIKANFHDITFVA